jgi:hypothetical protein
MINFKITGLDNTFISIEKPAGKAIPLKLGEIVKAEVMDMLPTGGVTLKIKGDFITAKTEVPLEKGAVAFFKVTDLPVDGKDLKLQFMGYTDETAKRQEMPGTSFNLKDSDIPKLIQELTNSLAETKNSVVSGERPDAHIAKLKTLNSEILKALPSDINSLPKEVRVQLQNLLQASLKVTGESIQTRLDKFINRLPEGIKNHPFVENLKKDLMVSIERLLQTSIKSVLQDTGIVLEAKLKAVAELFQQMEQSGDMKSPSGKQETAIPPLNKDATATEQKQSLVQHDTTPIKKDLKAGLLQLKQLIMEEGKETIKTFSGHGLTAAQRESAVRGIDGLLKDIETFQLLSKTTDSFYTFLPINWQDLRDGEISFKRGRSDAKGTSYSCRINLDLERFGKLTIMVLIYNREFFVSFTAENPEFQKTLINNVSVLQESFKARGLNLKAVNVLDRSDASLKQLERIESSEKMISIKA